MRAKLTFLGIDVGLSGGIAAINDDKIETWVMPTRKQDKKRVLDHQKLSEIFANYAGEETFAIVEYQQAMPKQGVSSMFSLGYGYGAVIQCLVDHSIHFDTVRPREWQHEFGISAKKGDTKKQALEICRKLFPQANLLATSRSRKPHDGLADAVLICAWGKKHFREERKSKSF